MTSLPEAGNPQHPDHEKWLLELGRATYEAARVAGICFDLVRVLGGVDSSEMYSDPLGTLITRLNPLRKTQPALTGLDAFIKQLDAARLDRNDLLHALPVANGLHRRMTNDLSYVRNFYRVEDLAAVTSSLSATARRGNELLYQDGGAAIRAWYQAHL